MVFNMLWTSTLETLYMVFFSTVFALILGLPFGILLVITKENGLWTHPKYHQILETAINVLRSFPFIILMIVLFPLSRVITGTTIGSTAAIVPLSIGMAPFVARMIESSLSEVDSGLIEASESMGASNWTIISRVMIPEAASSLINGITITIISLIGYSSMAGAIGAGGLGDLAIRYGYQRFQVDIMCYAIIILLLIVQLTQGIGNFLIHWRKKKLGQS